MKKILHNKKNQIFIIGAVVVIAFVFSFFIFKDTGEEAEAASWFNEDWYYRQSSVLTNSTSTDVINQYVKVTLDTSTLITNGKMQDSCDDLRVTSEDGKLLPFFVDGDSEYTCNDTDTAVWVLVDSLPLSGSTIYIYYGNPSAENVEVAIGSSEYPAISCRNILEHGDSIGTGQYYITSTGNTADKYDVTCNMDRSSGGWMKVYEGLCTSASAVTRTEGDVVQLDNNIPFNNLMVDAKNWDFTETGTTTETAIFHETFSWYFEWVHDEPDSPNPDVKFHDLDGNQDVQFATLGVLMRGYGNSWRHIVNPEFNVADHDSYMYVAGMSSHGINQLEWDGDNYVVTMNNLTPLESGLGLSPRAAQEINIWIREDNITLNNSDFSAAAPASEEQGPGPVMYLSFDEGYGQTAYDSSPNDYDGTITGATWIDNSQCIKGKCLYFDGDSDWVELVGDRIWDDMPDDFTISAWIKPMSLGNNNQGRILDAGGGNSSGPISLNLDSNNQIALQSHDGTSSSFQNSADNTITLGDWQHLLVTYDTTATDDGKFRVYINGDFKEEISNNGESPLGSADGTVRIGARPSDDLREFEGYMDEFKFYNYIRTADQVKQDYNKGLATYFGSTEDQGLSDGLVGYWKMDETTWNGTAGEVVDASGNGNHGTSTNAVTTSTAKFGRAGYFDGSNDDIQMGNVLNMGTDSFAMSAWVKHNEFNQADVVISKTNGAVLVGDPGYQIWINTSNQFEAAIGGGSSNYIRTIGSTAINNSDWHHVTAVFDRQNPENSRIFLDGIDDTSDTLVTINQSDSVDSTVVLTIAEQPDGSNDFAGFIDEMRIYKRVLSKDEVHRLYEWTAPPVTYYNFDEHSGVTLYDQGNNANNGTLGGGMSDGNWVPGKFGSALDFDGSSNQVDMTDISIDRQNGSITLWFKVDPTHTFAAEYMQIMGTNAGAGFIGMYSDDLRAESETNEVYWGSMGAYGINISAGQWYHWALSARDGTVKSYINGRLNTTLTPSDNLILEYIGRYFDGVVDEVKIYDYGISERQVLEDMNGGKKNNPIGYWSFDEGQGTTAYDYGVLNDTGNENNGTLNNMSTTGTSSAWTTSGKKGGALKFDGVNDQITISNDSWYQLNSLTDKFSLSAWVKINEASIGNAFIVGKNSAYALSVGTDLKPRMYFGASSVDVVANSAIVAGTWNHILGIFDAGTAYLYINGVLDTSGSISASPSQGSNLTIGGIGTSNYYFNGSIDEVKVYNYALTLDEIRENYNQGKQTVLSKTKEEVANTNEGLVGWWKMDESSWSGVAGEVIDYSGLGNHGTSAGNANSTSTAKFGRAGEFDGSGDYVDIGNTNFTIDNTNEFSIGMWFNIQSDLTDTEVLARKGQFIYPFSLHLDNSERVVFGTRTELSTAYLNTNTTLSLDTWYHVTATYKNSVRKIFIDGQEVATDQTGNTLQLSSVETYLGNVPNDTGGGFPGMIDDVKIYNRAKSADEIYRDFTEGPPPLAHWKFDEKSGQSTVDSSGMGYYGTLGSSSGVDSTDPTWQSAANCKIGSCLKFDGSNDYVEISNYDPKTYGNFSISAWYKSDIDTVTDDQYIFVHRESSSQELIFSVTDDSSHTDQVRLILEGDGYSNFVYSTTDVVDKNWHHILVVRDNGTFRLYVDGNLETTEVDDASGQSITIDASSGPFIGDNPGDTEQINGWVDDIKIYDYALNTRQIMQEYNDGKPIGHWKFDKGEGGTAYDYSGNGNDGTIYPGTGGTNTATSTMWSNGTSGKINGSLDFDGTDDLVSISGSQVYIDQDLPFTFSAWAYLDAFSPAWPHIATLRTDTANAWEVGFSQSVGVFFGANDTWATAETNQPNSDLLNAWHHVIVTYDGVDATSLSSFKLYLDGEEIDFVSSGTFTATSQQSSIGGDDVYNHWFNGQIDEVKIFNYLLTPEDVKKDYNGGFSTYFK